MSTNVIEVARGLIGSHYINGAYGAIPGVDAGCPITVPRPIKLVADPKRLDPTKKTGNLETMDLAVFAAQFHAKQHAVCAGSYATLGNRPILPTDPELLTYLASLKGKPPTSWLAYRGRFTPRRAYGPAQGGGLGGILVWGESCQGKRHFDCIGFISYCYWKATGRVIQLEISGWRTPGGSHGGTVFNLKAKQKPASLMDGDVIIKQDHHIAFVNAQGTVFQAEDTHIGVTGHKKFSLDATGDWTHLVRLPYTTAVPLPEWLLGWWKVWDGKAYYYYFGPNGVVQSTKTSPGNTKAAPKSASNSGRYVYTPPNRLVVTWNKVAGASTSCVETFYNAVSECTQMNANSNLYSPLVATRMS